MEELLIRLNDFYRIQRELSIEAKKTNKNHLIDYWEGRVEGIESVIELIKMLPKPALKSSSTWDGYDDRD